ncbi:hypothetical protein BDR07DRAFT_1460848, partial [Suillus spraguei]
MSADHRTDPPPGTSQSPAESSSPPHDRFRQVMRNFKKNVIRKVSKLFKRSRHQTPAIQNADHEGASSNQNVEDVLRLHPSNHDEPATSENPSGCMDQEVAGEPTSKALDTRVEEMPDPRLVAAELHGAHEGAESMRLLVKHVTSVASAAKDGPKDLPAADDFQTTNLHSLRIFDTVIRGLADVHPYAKVVLGILSAASKIILAQTERDQSVQSLLE